MAGRGRPSVCVGRICNPSFVPNATKDGLQIRPSTMTSRRRPMRLLLPFLIVTAPLAAADWPLHRGNATQTGVSEDKLPDKLDIRWEFKAKNSVEGAVVIAD